MSLIHNALSGSLAARLALNAVSQNIANVMTPGYTRQGALLATVMARQPGTLSAGDGVQVPSLIRFSDGYKSQQMWQSASELASHTVKQSYLAQLEQVMGDDASGINSGLDVFFGALNAASVEPSSSPLRQQVITAADALSRRFTGLSQVLSNQRNSVSQQRGAMVAEVNAITAGIAELNNKLTLTRAAGVDLSGLMDARDQKIDALASLLAVHVIDQPDGTRSVTLRSGQPMVVGATAATLKLLPRADGSAALAAQFASANFALVSGQRGGSLGGLDDLEHQVLEPLRQSLVDMASELATRVNAQLAAGFALDGRGGGPLFAMNPASSTELLRVAPGVLAQDLGFSSNATQPGDSSNLLALIDIKQRPIAVTSLGTVLLGDASTQLIGKLGMDSQQSRASLATATTVRNYAEESWKSTSGVNSDEEAIHLIEFQQMYQANMKVIAVANQLFDSTLAMMN